ncbi:MAG: hypothetical protein GEU99_10300 [Luteitalea sp.]|nr:hypothetical protein [Luteitalea sp.]
MTGSTVCRLVLGLALVPALATAQGPQVQLTLTDSGVTLVTENATPREILAEWTRVTGAKVVGGERLAGDPLTLQLENVSERQALDAVLRSAANYIVADRDQPESGASQFDRIVLVPRQSKPAPAAAQTAVAARTRPQPYRPDPNAEPVSVDEILEEQDAAAEAAAAEAAAQMDDQTGATPPTGSPTPVPAPVSPVVDPNDPNGEPTSTDFDYANPQKYFQMRAQQMQERLRMQREAGSNTSSGQTGSIYVPTAQRSGVTVVGGSATGSQQSGDVTVVGGSTTGSRAGRSTTPTTPGQTTPGHQTTPGTPYGLPSDVAPGSQAPPPGSPAYNGRYFNPYLPSSQQARPQSRQPDSER